MPAATGPAYVPSQPTGAANDSGGRLSFLDRFFGADTREAVAEKALDARDRVTQTAQDARANLSVAGGNLAATARAHPVLAVLANPATRRAAIAGGATLWNKYGDRLPGLLPNP